MRIGIEAQRLFRKNKHGMDIVALELIRALQKMDTQNQYFVFVKADDDSACLSETDNFKIITTKKYPYPWWEQVQLRKLAKTYNLDLLHCTSNTAPVKTPVPLVVTVHDIIYLERLNLKKGSAYQIFGNLYRRWNVPRIVNDAHAVVTVSAYEKNIIETRFPDIGVTTIYNGINESFKKVSDNNILQTIKSRYKLPDEFIFFLGNTDPKKNLSGVLKAFSILLGGRPGNTPKLVMPDLNKSFLDAAINSINPNLREHIITTGYIPNYELPAIYSMATLFIYPSLRESFGIPILEAMACGAPVITSNTSSMPEVAGDAALLVDPHQPQQIAEAIASVLDNPDLRNSLILKGYERAKKFSWHENARQTLNLYNQVMSKKLT